MVNILEKRMTKVMKLLKIKKFQRLMMKTIMI